MLMENKQQKKKTRNPTRESENRPDFPGRVGFQTEKPDFFRVGFRVTVNPTRPNISPTQDQTKLFIPSKNFLHKPNKLALAQSP